MRTAVDARIEHGLNASYEEDMLPVISAAMSQLDAYFNGTLIRFDLPLLCVGTEFQQRV